MTPERRGFMGQKTIGGSWPDRDPVRTDPLTLPETAGDYPPERSTAFLAGVIFGLLVAAVVLVVVAR